MWPEVHIIFSLSKLRLLRVSPSLYVTPFLTQKYIVPKYHNMQEINMIFKSCKRQNKSDGDLNDG